MGEGPKNDNAFGRRLWQLRQAAGLTQEALAQRAGLSTNAVSDLERGKRRRPYPDTVRSLADALQLDAGQLAQLRAAARPDAVDVAPDDAPRAALPYLPTALIGRDREVHELRSALTGGHRLVTLTGPGGVGKTRLAAEVARDLAPHYPAGTAFVSLAPVTDPALLLPTVAAAVGLQGATGGPAAAQLHAFLRGKQFLLVLDNLEHLLDGVLSIHELVAGAPSLQVLATSRAVLRLQAEREYRVAPLAVPNPTRAADVDGVMASAAGRLFLERARQVDAGFVLTERNAATVAAICWRLDGLPLALELAAAGTRVLGATELLSRLDQALEGAGAARDLPDRQHTMRATLDWSYQLLSEQERAAFRSWSVFAGGFTLEAAEAVASDARVPADAVRLLGALVEQSMVTVVPSPHGTSRYGMLEPIRQYALGQLRTCGEEDSVRARHADSFQALAHEAQPQLSGADQAWWLDRLAIEHDNLRLALAWLLDHGQAARVVGIASAIHLFWSQRGHTAEGRRMAEQALAQAKRLSDADRARASYVVGMLSYVRGEMVRAQEAADASVDAARKAGDAKALARGLLGSGLTALTRGELDRADEALLAALPMFEADGDRSAIALTQGGLAQLALRRGDVPAASQALATGERAAREAGDWFALTATLCTDALVARLDNDLERTTDRLRESVELAAGLRDAWHLVYAVTGMAGVAARKGKADRATLLFGAADSLCRTMGVDVPVPAWRTLNERDMALAREQLDSRDFDEFWAQGQEMDVEQTVQAAIDAQ